MIGYSQYVQENASEILRQKINVFLVAYFTFTPSLLNFVKNEIVPVKIREAIKNILFSKFVRKLKEDNVYEEYLISSLFTKNSNYDFITKQESEVVVEAQTSLKENFLNVMDEYVGKIILVNNFPQSKYKFPNKDSFFDTVFLANVFRKYLLLSPFVFYEKNGDEFPIFETNNVLDKSLKSLINFNEES
tara:strand:+ start:1649 stop:2215 length:567 start_codon:yes stop_codon:yes gene_type:complete